VSSPLSLLFLFSALSLVLTWCPVCCAGTPELFLPPVFASFLFLLHAAMEEKMEHGARHTQLRATMAGGVQAGGTVQRHGCSGWCVHGVARATPAGATARDGAAV
jgi:hypothetical protein